MNDVSFFKEDVVGKALGFETRCYDHRKQKWRELEDMKQEMKTWKESIEQVDKGDTE